MKCTYLALGSFLASVAVAQPHRPHQAFHHKRAADLVWVTKVDTVYETVGYTTTIWVSEGFVPPKSADPTTSSAAYTPVAAQFFEPAPSSPAELPAPTTASPSPVSSPPAAIVDTPAPAPYVAPAAPTPVAAPAPASGSSGGSGGQCSEGSPCSGDITHYDTSLGVYGACGYQNDGLTEKVIALPHGLMGTQSNGNPYCGKTVTIVYNGKSTTAKVVDKCMGCTGFSIDLSDAAFQELADMGLGRTTASWYFN